MTPEQGRSYGLKEGVVWVGHEGLPVGMSTGEAVALGILKPGQLPGASYYIDDPRFRDPSSALNKNYYNGTFLNDTYYKTPVPKGMEDVINPNRFTELGAGQAQVGGISRQKLGTLGGDQRQALGSFVSKSGESLEDYLYRSSQLDVGYEGLGGTGVRRSTPRAY
jgi:hypothetical protein